MKLRHTALWTVLALTTACATTPKTHSAREAIKWPAPPDPARVEFLRSYRTELDVEKPKGLFARIFDAFGGREKIEQLNKPMGILSQGELRLYVSDTVEGVVWRFDLAAGTMIRLGKEGPLPLKLPLALAGDGQGGLFVVDGKWRRVVHLDGDGGYLEAFGSDEDLVKPVGVAYDTESGRLYVSDVKAHQVVVYDTETAKKLFAFGERGGESGQFNFPTHLALSPNGTLAVMDAMNFRVQVFDREGIFQWQVGANCSGPGCMPRSKGVGFDTDGRLYVVDSAFSVVQLFDDQGRLLMAFGGYGATPGLLNLPAGIHVDARNHIFVVDQINRRVNEYRLIPDDEVVVPADIEVAKDDAGEGPAEGAEESI